MDTLQTTIMESGNYGVTDCQSWKRLESTHVDHVADALGHMTIWTEDFSIIQQVPEEDKDLSFKTALEEVQEEAPKVLAEDSEVIFSKASLSPLSDHRVSEWVLSSPFQSRDTTTVIPDATIVISESDDNDDEEPQSEVTSNLNASAKNGSLTEATEEGSQKIAQVWCLDSSDEEINNTNISEVSLEDNRVDQTVSDEDEESVQEKSLQVSMVSSRSVSLQVSIASDDDEKNDEEKGFSPTSFSEKENFLPNNTLSEVLGDEERNSQGNILFLEDDDEDQQYLTFLTSLSLETVSDQCHPEAIKYVKHFNRHKNELLQRLFDLFNKHAFDNQLPSDLPLLWNSRLTKTAGFCVQRKIRCNDQEEEERLSKIELSSKVIDSADRLRDTLIHEMCHAAAWIKSGVRDGHGSFWKAWAARAMAAFPELPIIARCHSYVIRTKFTYLCQKCGQRIDRHSKSINVTTQSCKLCGGQFKLLTNNLQRGGAGNKFTDYIKENYQQIRTPDISHADAMRLLSRQYAESKLSPQ